MIYAPYPAVHPPVAPPYYVTPSPAPGLIRHPPSRYARQPSYQPIRESIKSNLEDKPELPMAPRPRRREANKTLLNNWKSLRNSSLLAPERPSSPVLDNVPLGI